ncbi:MAG: nucleotide exchange factor GrpE [Geminicoccaceae bacterium]|nr:MAG: nucleotide exchange factor GrpE [Geminicoccaceae bacterium]
MTDKPQHQAEPDATPASETAPADATTPEPAAEAVHDTAAKVDLEAELAAAKDQLLRTLADMENLRRRTQREIEDARRYAVTGFARDLLEVADNLGRAVATIPPEMREQEGWAGNLATGIAMTERTLLSAFEKHKVQRVAPQKGEKFDHQRHQAMFEVPTADFPPGTIAEVMADGYVLADRLLRPAMVGVAKAPAAATPEPVDQSV